MRRIRHESAVGSWELVVRGPAPSLRPFVREYEGYVESGAAPVLRQEVPTTRLPLIVNLGAPWNVVDGSGRSELHGSFFAGLHDASAFVAATGPAVCLQVDLTPIGAHLLLGLPMHELANRVLDLDLLLPRAQRRLPEQLAELSSWDARFELLDSALAARVAEAQPPAPDIVWAWGELERTHGRVRIETLAERIGRSRRHLVARFREHVGLPPKTVARILRFHRAVELLREPDPPALAELAYICGYYDQAHLNRDFRQFARSSPGELARRIVPDGGVLA